MEKGTLIYKCPLLVVSLIESKSVSGNGQWYHIIWHPSALWAQLAKEPGHLPVIEFVAAGKKHAY